MTGPFMIGPPRVAFLSRLAGNGGRRYRSAAPSRTDAAPRSGPMLRLDQPAADGVARQLDAIAHAELVEDVLPVSLHGLDADHQLLGDLLRRIGLGDQLQHLQ